MNYFEIKVTCVYVCMHKKVCAYLCSTNVHIHSYCHDQHPIVCRGTPIRIKTFATSCLIERISMCFVRIHNSPSKV